MEKKAIQIREKLNFFKFNRVPKSLHKLTQAHIEIEVRICYRNFPDSLPKMLPTSATQIIGGTTSECIFESDEDQIGVHSKNCYGPHGSVLQKAKGTTWECISNRARDHIGVHSMKQKGPNGSALLMLN